MQSFFEEIFDYHYQVNQKILVEIIAHNTTLPEKVFSLFCHVLNAHQIWNSRINGTATTGVWQVYSFEECEQRDRENYRTSLEIIRTQNFEQVISYTTTTGQQYNNTIRDILFHIANHSTHHKGQIMSEFRRAGLEPFGIDYILYKR